MNNLQDLTLEGLSALRESEDHVEFKAARRNYPFAGGSTTDIRERRRCVLGCGAREIDCEFRSK